MLFNRFTLEDREPFARMALSRILENVDSKPHKAAVEKVLRNRQMRKAFVAEAWSRYEDEVGEDGRLLQFFQWILDNQEEILALIMTIVSLFA